MTDDTMTAAERQALVRDAEAALDASTLDTLPMLVIANGDQVQLTIDTDPSAHGHNTAYAALDALRAAGIGAADPDTGWTADLDRTLTDGDPVKLYRLS